MTSERLAGGGAGDLWSQLAQEQLSGARDDAANKEQQAQNSDPGDADRSSGGQCREANIVFVGDRQSGKSTLLQRFLSKGSTSSSSSSSSGSGSVGGGGSGKGRLGGDGAEVKPTTALDYKYTRSSVGISADKELAHFWELGGGRSLTKLLEVAVTSQSVADTLVVICVDLSKPSRVVESVKFWMKKVRTHAQLCLKKMSGRNPAAVQALQDRVQAVWGGHPDSLSITMPSLPIMVVGAKYDLFKQQEAECLKVMARTLRAISLSYGASLMYAGDDERSLTQVFRTALSRHVMNRDPIKTLQVEHTHPLVVPPGRDEFSQIGVPPSTPSAVASSSSSSSSSSSGAAGAAQGWAAECMQLFPPSEQDARDDLEVDSLQLEPEPIVDSMLAQRTEDLKRIRHEAQLKMKLQLAGTSSSSSSSSSSSRKKKKSSSRGTKSSSSKSKTE